MRIGFLSLLFFLCFIASLQAQSETLTQFRGVFTWRDVTAYGDTSIAHYSAKLADFNDQTGQYLASDIDSLCIAWDNLGGRWDIVQVDSATVANAWVLIKSLNGVYASPFGVGFVSLETSAVGLSLTAPDNSTGISPQLQSNIESHNMLLLDNLFDDFVLNDADTLWVTADSGDTLSVILSDTVDISGGFGILTSTDGDRRLTIEINPLTVATVDSLNALEERLDTVEIVLNDHLLEDQDRDSTNELQAVDTLSLSGTTLNLSLSSDGTPAATVNLAPILSGYTTGSGVATRVAFWSGPDVLSSSENLYWDNSNSRLGIGTAAPAGKVDISTPTSYDGLFINSARSPQIGLSTTGGVNYSHIAHVSNNTDWATGALANDMVIRSNAGHVLTGINGGLTTAVSTTGLGIFTRTPSYAFDINSTGGMRIAVGTTAQRPTNAAGVKRYNTTLGYSETANGSAWLQSDFPVGTSGQTLRYDGTSWIANSFLYNRGDFVGINFSGTPANTLHVAGGVTIEESGTGNDFFSMSGSTGFINFGNRGAGWGMAQSATGSSDEDGSVFRFFPSTRYDDSGFTNVGYSFLGRINTNQTVSHTIFQIRDEGTAAPTSGTSTRTYLEIYPQLNKGASANLTGIGIHINPVLTSATDFYALAISSNAYKAIWQSGASATNHLAGNTIVGSTGTPAQDLHVAGTMRLTGSDGTATALMGRDADGDISAISEGYGINITAGALEVDTTQIATQSDLDSVAGTTLYTGDGTIANYRTVTITEDSTLTFRMDNAGSDNMDLYSQWGYAPDWGANGFINYGLSDSFEVYNYLFDDGTGAYFGNGVFDNANFSTAFFAGNANGNMTIQGSDGISNGSFAIESGTEVGFAPRIAGDNGIEFDTGGGDMVFQIGNITEATMDATGLGIGDTSPESELDVAGLGKFRRIAGQDGEPTTGTNANMGTGRSITLTTSHSSGVAGRVSITSGTGLTAGEWFTFTFPYSFSEPPAVQLFPEDIDGASLMPYVWVQPTTTGCSFQVNATGAPWESKTYEFNYIIIGGK